MIDSLEAGISTVPQETEWSRMNNRTMQWLAAVVVFLGCGDAGSADAQDIHPQKAVFADAESWSELAVGDQGLANFHPFRAKYERVYRDQQGQERRDHVIITAERVAWNETSAISVSLVDAGSSEYDDTAMRIQTRVFSEDDQSLLLYIAPAPGTPRDYVIAHTDGTVRATLVDAASGEGTSQPDVYPLPQLGAPGLWLVASMDLRVDQKIAFSNADAPAPSSILGARPVLVSGQERVDAGPMGRQDAWVITYPLGMANARVMHNFVVDRPPYLLGKRPMDLATGETSEIGTLRLVEFTTFGEDRP